jgi:hypothetical protein
MGEIPLEGGCHCDLMAGYFSLAPGKSDYDMSIIRRRETLFPITNLAGIRDVDSRPGAALRLVGSHLPHGTLDTSKLRLCQYANTANIARHVELNWVAANISSSLSSLSHSAFYSFVGAF